MGKPQKASMLLLGLEPWTFELMTKDIEAEHPKAKFEMMPTLMLGDEFSTHVREDTPGRLKSATVVVDKGVLADLAFTVVATKHELRENLLFQNYASERQAHAYALSKEADDWARANMSDAAAVRYREQRRLLER